MRGTVIFAAAFVALFVGVTALVICADALQHWIAIHSGTDYLMCGKSPCANQVYYNWWSGAGSDIAEITLVSGVLTGLVTTYKVRECHNQGCHWPAQFTSKDGDRLCHRCKGKPHHKLRLRFIHPHHRMHADERLQYDQEKENAGAG